MEADPEIRAFLTWMSHVLRDTVHRVTELPDLKSGVALIRLAEHLFHDTINPRSYRAAPKRELDMILNCNCVVEFLKAKGVKIVGTSGKDIFELKVRPLFGLLANLCFNHNTEAPPPPPQTTGREDPLLTWVKSTLDPHEIAVRDFASSWSDGHAFYSLIALISPETLDLAAGSSLSPAEREVQGLSACERLGIPVYANAGAIATAAPSPNVVKMQIQAIYRFSTTDHSQPAPTPLPAPAPAPEPPSDQFPTPAPSPPSPERAPEPQGSPEPSTRPGPDLQPSPVAQPLPPAPELRPGYCLGIDFGASNIRFSVFSGRKSRFPFDVHLLDPAVGIDAEGKVVAGSGPDLCPIPSIRHLIGRQFNDPVVSDTIKEGLVPIFERVESHTCAISVNGHTITPESVVVALFSAVRSKASESVGEPVVDASIAVPTMLTSAQREAIRDAAQNAGLHVSHIASGSAMAAQAMKVSGERFDLGLSLIVDIGASKTEVSLIQNDADGVREVRTAGSDKIGGNQVRAAVVERVLATARKRANSVRPAVRAALEAQAEVAIMTDGHITVADLGDGESFEAVVTPEDISACCSQVADGVTELLHEVVNQAESEEVHCVRCIGGGTKLPALEQAVQSALPAAELRQFDPHRLISCGATLDGADRTDRLPPSLKTQVITVVPYSIGISMVGDVISFVIQRGESLPAVGEIAQTTTVDDQETMQFQIWQGEHVLTEFSDRIGTARLTDLPRLPRGQCVAVCRIEYDENGILQFSAREKTTGKSVQSQFTTKTEFTEADRARLTVTRPHDQAEEMSVAESRFRRENIKLDIQRGEKQQGSDEFKTVVAKWRTWIDAHETGDAQLFWEKQNEALREFWQLNPELWHEPGQVDPDVGFREIWPRGPVSTKSGWALIRFLTSPDFSSVAAHIQKIQNAETPTVTSDIDVCQFMTGEGIESIVRIYFPENGKYTVSLTAGPKGTRRVRVNRTSIGRSHWHFEVSGCSESRRPLCQVISGREFLPLACPDNLKITPGSSCVQIPGTKYTFSCDFQGEWLGINGREPLGAEKRVIHPTVTEGAQNEGWSHQDCVLEFPSPGVWRVLFGVGGQVGAIQTIVAGEMLAPTSEERIALAAPLVE